MKNENGPPGGNAGRLIVIPSLMREIRLQAVEYSALQDLYRSWSPAAKPRRM